MNSSNYTLDRFEGDFAIFLKRPEETERLQIHRSELNVSVNEGDIVQISHVDGKVNMTVLKEETASKKDDIQNLLNQLKNKHK